MEAHLEKRTTGWTQITGAFCQVGSELNCFLRLVPTNPWQRGTLYYVAKTGDLVTREGSGQAGAGEQRAAAGHVAAAGTPGFRPVVGV